MLGFDNKTTIFITRYIFSIWAPDLSTTKLSQKKIEQKLNKIELIFMYFKSIVDTEHDEIIKS